MFRDFLIECEIRGIDPSSYVLSTSLHPVIKSYFLIKSGDWKALDSILPAEPQPEIKSLITLIRYRALIERTGALPFPLELVYTTLKGCQSQSDWALVFEISLIVRESLRHSVDLKNPSILIDKFIRGDHIA